MQKKDSRPRAGKSRAPARRKAAQFELTDADAQMLFDALTTNRATDTDNDARADLLEYVDQVISYSPRSDPACNKEYFIKHLLAGWARAHDYARASIAEIVQRLHAGQMPVEIYTAFEQERAAWRAEREAKERHAPEPSNWLSAEWRMWKSRHLSRGIAAGDAAAWDEYQRLLRELVSDENFYHVSFALALLPQLLSARQTIAGLIGQARADRRKPEYFNAKKGAKR